RGLVVGQRGRSAQGQHACRSVVAAGDTVLIGETEHVLAAGKISGNRDRGACQSRAVRVADCQRAGNRRRSVVFGVRNRGPLDAVEHRGNVRRQDRNVARARVAQVASARAVVHLEADRSHAERGRAARVRVGDRSQGGLIVGNRRGPGEYQDSGGRNVTAGNAVLV